MIELVSVIITVLAVAGVILNNNLCKYCFVLWIFSNSLSAGVHLYSHLWTLTGRDLIFLILAIHGWHNWRKKLIEE